MVYVHPFAEEMNKSRRMAALQSRALAQAGYAVLQVDLLGCGDSSGDFRDASWADWLDDVVLAVRWMQQRHDAALWLWGLRAGCLLAAAAAQRMDAPCHFLFWQPVLSGKATLQQFLRLKAAARLASGESKAILHAARADLHAGRPVEVAGYTLTRPLSQGLEAATLAPSADLTATPGFVSPNLIWLELSNQPVPTLSPASQPALQAWQAAGWAATALAIPGPSFWQTVEIEEAPALLDATLGALAQAHANPRLSAPLSTEARVA